MTKIISPVKMLVLLMTFLTVLSFMSVNASAYYGEPHGYYRYVTTSNTNASPEQKYSTSSVKSMHASGSLASARVAVYAVRPNGTSYNATYNPNKYYNTSPGTTRLIKNLVREEGNNECYLSMSAYSGSGSVYATWYADI